MMKIALTTAAVALLTTELASTHYTTTTTAAPHKQALGQLIDYKASSADLLANAKLDLAHAKGELKDTLLNAKVSTLGKFGDAKDDALASMEALKSLEALKAPVELDLGSLDIFSRKASDLDGLCYKDSHCAQYQETEARCDKHHEFALLGQCAYGHKSSLGLSGLEELKSQLSHRMQQALGEKKQIDSSLLKEFLLTDKKLDALKVPNLDLHARGIAMDAFEGIDIPKVPSLTTASDYFKSFDIKKACFKDDHCDGVSLKTSIETAKKELATHEYDHHCEKKWGEFSVGQCSYGEAAAIGLKELLAARSTLLEQLNSGVDMGKLHDLWALSSKIDTQFPEFDLCALSSKAQTAGEGFLHQLTGAVAGH